MVSEQLLAGQKVLVIGGSDGIGLEAARLARREGASAIITARDADRLVRAGIDLGGSVAAFDATDFHRLQRFVDELPHPIDHILLAGPASYEAPLANVDRDAVHRDIDAHLLLPVELARHARIVVRPGGTLTFLGCTDDRRSGEGIAITSALTAALSTVTRDLARALAPIRVNLIAAGFVDRSSSAAPAEEERASRRDQLREILPAGQVAEPGHIAALAVHLMVNSAVTGATFDIDAGQHLL